MDTFARRSGCASPLSGISRSSSIAFIVILPRSGRQPDNDNFGIIADFSGSCLDQDQIPFCLILINMADAAPVILSLPTTSGRYLPLLPILQNREVINDENVYINSCHYSEPEPFVGNGAAVRGRH
jgi:hypothetical protein